jgi:hypothetical protein
MDDHWVVVLSAEALLGDFQRNRSREIPYLQTFINSFNKYSTIIFCFKDTILDIRINSLNAAYEDT